MYALQVPNSKYLDFHEQILLRRYQKVSKKSIDVVFHWSHWSVIIIIDF